VPDTALSSSSPPLVLLVDAQSDRRDLYRSWLERGGVHVVDASSADEALVLADLFAPHVVATEMGLPAVDGYELCRQLRQRPETCHIPIIAVAAWAMADEVQRAWDVGCDAVVSKPCAPEALLAEIVRLLRLPSVPAAKPA
jgi:CheY-like chemotaxis protein